MPPQHEMVAKDLKTDGPTGVGRRGAMAFNSLSEDVCQAGVRNPFKAPVGSVSKKRSPCTGCKLQ